MKNLPRRRLLIFLLLLLAGSFLFLAPKKAAAYDYTDYLMDDSVYRNAYSMNATQILNFLQQEGSGLASFSDVYVCGYPTDTNFNFYNQHYDCNVAAKDSNGNTYYQTQPQSAALIIAEAAQAYGINPQVLLATLQKEQSLITTPNPTASQLNCAMGYNSCGGFVGFFNQVDNATWQFRTYFELGSGNNWWGYTPSSYPCRTGVTSIPSYTPSGNNANFYYPGLYPGNDVHFYDYYGNDYTHFVLPNISTAGLYCYTPHVFPGSSAVYYSGSYNFVYYFSLWFGSSTAPYAFKGANSSTIYFYINGNKVAVNAMGIIQDFSVAPQAIHVLDQSTADSIPTPTDGTSATLNNLIKTPSEATVYLVTVGKKYSVTSQQMTDFGFNSATIATEPASFVQSIPSGGALSNFIKSPYGAVFDVTSGQKQLVLDYAKYISLNPSDTISYASYYFVNSIPSGTPLSSRDILVKYASGDSVYLFLNGNYYLVPNFYVYSCWGFESTLKTPVYRLPDNSYASPISSSYSLDCLVKNTGGNVDLMGNTVRYSPIGYGLTRVSIDNSDIVTLSQKIPAVGTPLQYIKSNDSAAVWYLTGSGTRELVPTYTDFLLLGLNSSKFTTMDWSVFSSIPSSGIKLGNGRVVKTDSSAAVYAISGSSRLLYSTSDDFLAYHNNWLDIGTYPSSTLDSEYPYSNTVASKYFYDQPSDTVYLVDKNGCYGLGGSLVTSYGQNQSQIASNQTYTISVFPNLSLSSCVTGSVYVKPDNSYQVYLINNGQKQAFATWNALVNYSGTSNPRIITLSPSTLATFSTGSTIN